MMLNTLVDTSRIALGSLVLQPSDIHLVDNLRKVVADAGPEVARRVKLNVEVEIDPFGWWDPQRLRAGMDEPAEQRCQVFTAR